ncbi:hypothetical protein QUA81_18430 [Microcoleus sp. F6_B4]
MLLPSPAIAATSSWITVNHNNETELLQSREPAIVLLVSKDFPQPLAEDLKSKTEKFYGDKYKYVTGTVEENGFLYSQVLAPRVYPPFPGLLAVTNGNPTRGVYVNPNDPTQAFEFVKEQLTAGY